MEREKSRRNKTVFLPQDLIIKILLRLPVKSLLRFKCVCKAWLSLISDPHFAKSHFELSAVHTERLLLLETYTPTILSIDFNASLHDDSACASLNLNFLVPNTSVYIRGSTRGFVLLDFGECFLVWNPSTGVYKQVSYSPSATNPFLFGFGYDSSKDDYLVVQVSCKANLGGCVTPVEIFSLRANSWKEIEGLNLSYVNCHGEIRMGSLLNGALHWLALRTDVLMDVIIAFDLVEKSFWEIPPPVDLVSELQICKMNALGESLCLYIWRINRPIDIWVMKEYKVQSSWTKSFVVSVDNFPNRFFSVFCSTKSGDIVGSYGNTGLAKCNDEGQLLEHRSYCDRPNPKIMYLESLLSLPCDSEQAQEGE